MNYIRANNNSQLSTLNSQLLHFFTGALLAATGFATGLLATFTFALTILSLIVGCGTGMVGTIGGKSSRIAIIKHFLILINIHTKI